MINNVAISFQCAYYNLNNNGNAIRIDLFVRNSRRYVVLKLDKVVSIICQKTRTSIVHKVYFLK